MKRNQHNLIHYKNWGTEESETEELPYSGSHEGMDVNEENVLESSLNVEQQTSEVKESVEQFDQNSEKVVYNEEESDRTEELLQVESESPGVPEIIKEPDTYYDEELSNDEKNNLPNELS
uniref:Highly acidic protein n=1 Tax=Strongyloides papillosus TaxID=174720 RepID=A0A0N5BEG4_STREA